MLNGEPFGSTGGFEAKLKKIAKALQIEGM
jgi:hypothetical protein